MNWDYFAGFFDGEGSICICKVANKRSGNFWYRLNVSCVNTDSRPLHDLCQIEYGGKYFYRHPKATPERKDSYQMIMTGKSTLGILKKLEDKLILKKAQAKLGIEFQEWRNSLPNPAHNVRTKEIVQKSEYYWGEMKRLNQSRVEFDDSTVTTEEKAKVFTK
jgi:hypothetical protein